MSKVESSPEENPRRRRNSIMLPTKLNLHHQTSSSSSTIATTATSSSSSSSSTNSTSNEFDMFSIKPVSYTSLRDLLPPNSAVNSPRPPMVTDSGGSEISIRNRLVKQAAWAYLQPMSTSPDSSCRSFFSRFFFVNNSVARILEFVDRRIFVPLTRAVDWLLRVIRIRSSR